MALPEIHSIELIPPDAQLDLDSGEVQIKVNLKDGTSSSFMVTTPDRPGLRIQSEKKDASFGPPALFARRLDQETIGEAVAAMAQNMGGFWLRYYNSLEKSPGVPRPLRITSVMTKRDSTRGALECSASIEVHLEDGRLFSILSATPSWFEKTVAKLGFRFYFGPSILFVREMNDALMRETVKEMAGQGDRWLCRYDTPRTTLIKVLDDFKESYFR